ncbi:hypothetical protein ACFY6U_21555 [Streptomyces sp. NPDC013157]|uniref:hypothetical protein n=1 Tax=Streptomyces sp. NPDC013157 TaxID=3364861 RepID=UPI0036C992BA
MKWSGEDLARDAVRSEGQGLTAAQVTEKLAEAAVRVRENREQPPAPTGQSPYTTNPEDFVALWEAKRAEWARIAALMETSGWEAYDPDRDDDGTTWARERETRRQARLDKYAAWLKEHQEEQDGLRTQVYLPENVSRRLQAIASGVRLSPEQVLAKLARHAELLEDGTLTVAPFSPS